MQPHQATIDLYRRGQELNLDCPLRRGQALDFTAPGQVIVAGDLHGHERNFDKVVRFVALPENPNRHLVLQEILHAPINDAQEGCLSFRLLERALRLQKTFPHRVHFLLGNHAICQAFSKPVARAGGNAVELLEKGLASTYGAHAGEVGQAMRDFLLSELLAARLPNRVFLSHSLPSPGKMNEFNPQIIYKESLSRADYAPNGSAYNIVWGRRQEPQQLAELCKVWDIDLFVTGHQPQEMGFSHPNPSQVILASDNNHGCCLSIDLGCSYTGQTLASGIVRLAGVK